EFGQDAFSTEMLVFQGATRITATDTPVRFVNASPAAGRISIFVDDVLVARNLGVGEATIPLPLSRQSSVIRVVNSENRPLMSSNFRAALEQQPTAEKIIAFSDLPVDAAADENSARIEAHVFIRGEASSPALANIRLIHSLTG